MPLLVRGSWIVLLAVAATVTLVPCSARGVEPLDAAEVEFFETRIRPVLVEQCYECHNSGDATEGGLAVDHRRALLAGGDGGAVVVPGQPEQSRLLAILRHEVEGLEMPQGAAQLDPRVLADFERWIAAGAIDPRDEPPTSDELATATSWQAVLEKRKKWWSFQPILDPEVPAIDSPAWSDHPIDRFIAARLKENGLQPVTRASAPARVRRLFYVLIGLPPTPDEARHWSTVLAQPDGWEQLVDHLLARPEFGERWARHWMDWIRYAESHGSEGDPPIVGAWHYRDYLIRAFNDDIPYDQLVHEHLAGDLLESPRLNEELGINESRIGPAHWRMVFHGFAPTDALDEKVRFVDDQINTFSKAFLGLTVSCARCHDHKFDAISQRDYYALFGVLASCRPGRAAIDVDKRLDHNRDQLAELKPRIRDALAQDWLRAIEGLPGGWLDEVSQADQAAESPVLQPWLAMRRDVERGMDFATVWQRQLAEYRGDSTSRPDDISARAWHLGHATDLASWYLTGQGLQNAPSAAGEFAVAAEGDRALAGIYPTGVYSHSLTAKHAARLTSEDIALDGSYDLWLRVLGEGGATVRYAVQDYPRNGTVYPVAELSPTWKWQKFDLSYWNGDTIHIELASAMDAPLLAKENARSWFGIRQALLVPAGQPGPATETADMLAPLFATTAQSPPTSLDELATCYADAITRTVSAWRDGALDDAGAEFLGRCLQDGLVANRLQSLDTARPLIEEYRRLEADVPVPIRVPGLEETVGRDQPLFHRGDHKQPTDDVPRRFLEAIDDTPYATPLSGRLELAHDLLRDDNPLTRRVIVNRVWHHLFGQGLVATPDNFGSLGQLPSHPELLDWLAHRFVDDGWSLKRLIRRMVTSQTWQLDSQVPDDSAERDPENRLLSHAPVRRLEAEAIRDALLQVSGGLSAERFGPPSASSSARRSVYIEAKRNALDPFLRVFDLPEPFTTTGRRNATNVPAQSLAMMNDEFVASRAAAWAEHVTSDTTFQSDEQRIERMFQTAFARPASQDELDQLLSYLTATEEEYHALIARRAALRSEIEQLRASIEQRTAPVRSRLLETAGAEVDDAANRAPRPMAQWEFDDDFSDSIGGVAASTQGGARLEDGAVVLDGARACVVTEPLPHALREKTLEVVVQLADLEQRGGGVMTIQSPDGVSFDSIVFGEQAPGQWLAGSNNFRRTQPFGGPAETEATDRPVHLAIAYHVDGRIVGYRDGQPYGAAYQSEGPLSFAAHQAVVSFGVRHLPATAGRMLAGRIFRACLYDRALSDEEVLTASQATAPYISAAQIRAALAPEERAEVEQAEARIATLEVEIEAWRAIPDAFDRQACWTDLARALFCQKEFIYLK